MTCCFLQRDDETEMLQSTHAQELKALEFQLSTEQMQHQQSIQVLVIFSFLWLLLIFLPFLENNIMGNPTLMCCVNYMYVGIALSYRNTLIET